MPLNIEEFKELNNHKYVEMGLCSYCGACTAVCPSRSLRSDPSSPDRPVIVEDLCIKCGLCILVCPQLNVPASLYVSEPRMLKAYLARTTIQEVMKVAQDGGVTSTLAIYSLREGLIDAAILAGRGDEWRPRPMLARSFEDVVSCAGSKYLYAVNLLEMLRAVVNDPLYRSLMVVGVPCMARALWKMRWLGLRRWADKVRYVVGLFCTHNFTYTKLVEIMRGLGCSPGEVAWMGIVKGNMIFRLADGREVSMPVKETEKPEYLTPACLQCPEFVATFSDVSVGSIGAPQGWNSVIVHTEAGLELVEAAAKAGLLELKEMGEKSLKLIRKYIRRKRRHALKYVTKLYGITEDQLKEIASREDLTRPPTLEELGISPEAVKSLSSPSP